MPKSKKRGGVKKHRKRVKSRNDKKSAEQKRVNRIQREMFDQIMKEQESGAFDESKGLSNSKVDSDNDNDNTNESNDNELEL